MTYQRLVRLNRLTHIHEGLYSDLLVSILMIIAAVGFPLVVVPFVTLITGITYAVIGLRRPTFLLSYIGLFFVPLIILGGMLVQEFEWAGRRYRLNDEYDEEILKSD